MMSDSFCMVSGRVWQMSGAGRCNIDVKQLNRYYGRYSSIAFSPSGLPQAKYGGVWMVS